MAPTPLEQDFCLSAYSFDLPEEHIAQSPAMERCASRLMVLDRSRKRLEQGLFPDILRYLPEKCLLVANNSRVAPVRLAGKRDSGGKLECLLLTPPPLLERVPTNPPLCDASTPTTVLDARWHCATAEALLRPAKKIPLETPVSLAPDLAVHVLERGEFGRCRVRLYWRGELESVLESRGTLPLPPYIRRAEEGRGDWGTDTERYQTTYARRDKAGSAAAPTAGLHFTPLLREELERSGREWAEVTLYVGYGTFSPVRSEDIREHAMHAEYAELPARTLEAVRRAKAEGRAVIAVGTTSARVLEGVSALQSGLFSEDFEYAGETAFSDWISIFLYPGKPVRVIDGLITNFHLPHSSLLMLLSALAGRETILDAYREAVRSGFRFFSYGDAMLVL